MADNKLPALQFYTGDWRKDPGVQALDFFERGVWFEIICVMHESAERGKLILNGKKMPEEALARLLGLDNQKLNQILTKLVEYGVARQDPETGVIFNKRMVEDERIRQVRREAGKLGGNPALLNQKDNQTQTTQLKQVPTPSSSVSSSSSKDISTPSGVDASKPVDCPQQAIVDAYHEILPMLPRMRIWDDECQKFLRTRWREDPKRQSIDWWRQYFTYVRDKCPWLTGQVESRDGRAFYADMEWLVRPKNFRKVVRGNYEKKEAA